MQLHLEIGFIVAVIIW